MTLKNKFRGAYNTTITFEEQYEKYQNIAEEFALSFGVYLENAGRNKDLQKEIKEVFKTFKKEYE